MQCNCLKSLRFRFIRKSKKKGSLTGRDSRFLIGAPFFDFYLVLEFYNNRNCKTPSLQVWGIRNSFFFFKILVCTPNIWYEWSILYNVFDDRKRRWEQMYQTTAETPEKKNTLLYVNCLIIWKRTVSLPLLSDSSVSRITNWSFHIQGNMPKTMSR